MTPDSVLGDLIVLVADRNMQATVTGILTHPRKLGIRGIRFDVRRHPGKDGGCRDEGATFLAAFVGQYKHAILMFDHEGCGRTDIAPGELESQINKSLGASGWQDNATTIVLVPELDIWVWSDSPHVEAALGWRDRTPNLREWLVNEGYLAEGSPKPARPKEALEAALRVVRQPRSSSVYEELAGTVSYDRCTDHSFGRFRTVLRAWFAENT